MGRKKQFRVMTYNIHKGFDSYGAKYVLSRLRDAIRYSRADIVFLQEVMGFRSQGKDNQFEYLADSVWQHYAYGQNAIHSRGHHGNAILSKFPILSHENINISTNKLEQRGVLHGIIELPQIEQRLHLLCIHLNLLERGRLQQVQRLVQRVRSHVPKEDAMIIAGDSNDWRGRISQALKRDLQVDEVGLLADGEHIRTFPSMIPLLPLDRIYFRGLRFGHCEVMNGRRWQELSDHRAVVADFLL